MIRSRVFSRGKRSYVVCLPPDFSASSPFTQVLHSVNYVQVSKPANRYFCLCLWCYFYSSSRSIVTSFWPLLCPGSQMFLPLSFIIKLWTYYWDLSCSLVWVLLKSRGRKDNSSLTVHHPVVLNKFQVFDWISILTIFKILNVSCSIAGCPLFIFVFQSE